MPQSAMIKVFLWRRLAIFDLAGRDINHALSPLV